jgi:homoserine kinase type II
MAVYTKISQNDLEELLSNYEIGKPLSYTAIEAGIQNSNYFIDTDKARYVLTIYENRINLDDLPFFLNLTEHLATHGVPCPLPIANKTGEKISTIQGKPCAIISFVKGTEVKNINISHVSELGKNLAKMHLAGQDFPMQRVNEMGMDHWQDMLNNVKNRADEIENGISAEISEQLELLQKNWPKNLAKGIIHGDVFPDNVLFADNGSIAGIIDFYFACTDILIYDLAVCLNSWCFDDNKIFNQEKANMLISSYNKVRPISKDEMDALPILATGAAMRFLLSRMYGWQNRVEGAVVFTKDPLEYLQKLRFHSKIKSYEEYFKLEVRS